MSGMLAVSLYTEEKHKKRDLMTGHFIVIIVYMHEIFLKFAHRHVGSKDTNAVNADDA